MKRQIYPSTASAIAWWADNPNALKADCFSIALPTGETLYVTEGQLDLTVPAGLSPTGNAITFSASQYGKWSRGKITSDASFGCRSNTMDLTMVPRVGAMYPGLSIGILNAAFNHLFDGATVWVWTAYMPMEQYGVVQVFETKFQGRITESPDKGRLLCKFTCADPFFLLNLRIPSRLIQSNCFKSFTDANCGLSAADYTLQFTAGAGSTQTSLTPSAAFTQADGYFTQGVVTCLSGANSGLSQTVKMHSGGILKTAVPWLLPVAQGDTFSVIAGCDKTPTACSTRTHIDGTAEPKNFQDRFGGQPYVPPPSNSI